MMKTEDYLALITNEHSDKERFNATVAAGVSPVAAVQNSLLSLPLEFDIDTAAGVQLDVVGEWIGRSRRISTPLVGVYFSFDDTELDGWDSGSWKGPLDPESGLVELPDDAYRVLLKAKIAANSWDGSIPGAYSIWESTFNGETFIVIQDNQDMTMVVGIAGKPLGAVEKSLLLNGFFQLKPEGVGIIYWFITQSEGPLFAWDTQSSGALAGFDIGNWAVKLEI